MTSLLFLTQKETCKKAVYLLYKKSKVYNLQMVTSKTKVSGICWDGSFENKNYHKPRNTITTESTDLFRLHISCQRSNDAEFKLAKYLQLIGSINLLKPTGHVMHQQFNIQQLYVLPTLYLCVLYLSENKRRLVPLTA